MNVISRRNVLKFGIGIGLVAGISQCVKNVSSKEKFGASVDEFVSVHTAWFEAEKVKPQIYLSSLSDSVFTNSDLMQVQIESDFYDNRILLVNGLMLSKTEAALIAVALENQLLFI
jgi:hypothetical protein